MGTSDPAKKYPKASDEINHNIVGRACAARPTYNVGRATCVQPTAKQVHPPKFQLRLV